MNLQTLTNLSKHRNTLVCERKWGGGANELIINENDIVDKYLKMGLKNIQGRILEYIFFM